MNIVIVSASPFFRIVAIEMTARNNCISTTNEGIIHYINKDIIMYMYVYVITLVMTTAHYNSLHMTT